MRSYNLMSTDLSIWARNDTLTFIEIGLEYVLYIWVNFYPVNLNFIMLKFLCFMFTKILNILLRKWLLKF